MYLKELGKSLLKNNCESYNYSGIHFNKGGTDENNQASRINKTKRTIEFLHGILWSKKIEKQRKITRYNILIKITLMYGSEIWRIKEYAKRKIEATDMGALRRIIKHSRWKRSALRIVVFGLVSPSNLYYNFN